MQRMEIHDILLLTCNLQNYILTTFYEMGADELIHIFS